MHLTREQILGAKDLKREDVPVPEWGGNVLVRELSAKEAELVSRWYDDALDKEGVDVPGVDGNVQRVLRKPPLNMRARVAALCIINEDGSRMFSSEELDVLGDRSNDAINRIYPVVMRLSGMEVKEETEGNAEPGVDETSSSS